MKLVEVVGDFVLDCLLDFVRLEPVDLRQILGEQLVPCVNFLLGLPRLISQEYGVLETALKDTLVAAEDQLPACVGIFLHCDDFFAFVIRAQLLTLELYEGRAGRHCEFGCFGALIVS